MFFGTHSPRLDEKGRLVLPAKFRDELADGLVMAKGQEHAIEVWPAAAFAAHAARLNEASRTDAKVRAHLRVLFSGASDETPDKQGRVTIPLALREYAGLDREVTVIGQGQTFEIWDTAVWQAYLASHEDAFSSIDGEVIPGLL